MKKNFSYLIFILPAFLSACMAHFDSYPGEKQQAFPETMQGDYYIHDKPGLFYFFKKDTSQITISANLIGPVKRDGIFAGGALRLGDSIVFSRFGNYYALSQRDANSMTFWDVSIIKFDKNNIYVYPVEENKKYAAAMLPLFVNEAFIRNNRKWEKVVLNTEQKQFAMQRASTDTQVVFKMNEEGLSLFFERYLNNEKPLHLKRVKK